MCASDQCDNAPCPEHPGENGDGNTVNDCVYDLGLDKLDRAILRAMCEQFNGGPVGLSTVAISVGEQPDTVEDVYEPFLIQQGMIARTPRGRIAMPAAYHHLGLQAPTRSPQPGLFD